MFLNSLRPKKSSDLTFENHAKFTPLTPQRQVQEQDLKGRLANASLHKKDQGQDQALFSR